MQLDSFTGVVQNQLVAEGWTITSAHRYEPTVVTGITPTGKTFRLECAGNTCTLAIGSNTRTATRSIDLWRNADGTLAVARDLVASFPANQR